MMYGIYNNLFVDKAGRKDGEGPVFVVEVQLPVGGPYGPV